MSKKEIINRQQTTIDTMRQTVERYRFVNALLEKGYLAADKKRKQLKKRLKAYKKRLKKISAFSQAAGLMGKQRLLEEIGKEKDKALTDLTNELAAVKEENDALKCTNKILFDREDGEDIDAIIGDDGK